MAFVLMVEADFESFELVSQNDSYLNEETGRFLNPKWRFEGEYVTTDGTQFRREYGDGSNTIFLIADKTAEVDSDKWTDFKFYKEVV